MADYLLINLLDQIWIQEFYQPCISDVSQAYENEIKKCHKLGRFEDLMMKKHELTKLYKLMRKTEVNQNLKEQYIKVLSNKISEDNQKICGVENTIKSSITNLLVDTCNKTKGLSEFCQEIKMYQQTRFIPEEFQHFFYEEKASNIVKAFAKEVCGKLSEVALCPMNNSAKDLTLY